MAEAPTLAAAVSAMELLVSQQDCAAAARDAVQAVPPVVRLVRCLLLDD